MFYLQLESQFLTGEYDYLALVKDNRNIDGMYFNIKRILAKVQRISSIKSQTEQVNVEESHTF